MIDKEKLIKDVRAYADLKCANGEIELANGILKTLSIIEAQPNVDNWIPVSERLPEDGILVLIKTIVENNLEPTVGSWNETLGTWEIGNDAIMWDFLNDSLVNEVIAWMPLPEPLKEGEE